MNARSPLQITYTWKGQVLAYHLLSPRAVVTIGDRKGVTFVTPRLANYPGRFRLVRPAKDGVTLRVGPGIGGQIEQRGQRRPVADLLREPAVRRFLRDPGMFREAQLYPGDSATLDLDAANPGQLQLTISFSEAPTLISRPKLLPEPLLVRTTGIAAVVLLLLVFVARLLSDRLHDNSGVLTEERVRKVILHEVAVTKPEPTKKQREAMAAEARKRQEKEAAMSRRAREKEGRLGRQDAPVRATEIPRGEKDLLRAKVAKTGILAALGTARAPGSGLGRLFDRNDSADLEQAMNGISANRVVAGRGSGGMGQGGVGIGGGGTGQSLGRIAGSGDLDVGRGRGRGRKGPGLGQGKERTVSAGMETGNPNAEGGLTREQVARVVRAHAAAIKYCYEKELQRQPSLSGKIEVYWLIRANGTTDRVRVSNSTVGNREVEGCMERQVRNWQFPRSDSETIVQTFPFFFKGGGG
jgi:hypothetical protein